MVPLILELKPLLTFDAAGGAEPLCGRVARQRRCAVAGGELHGQLACDAACSFAHFAVA
jgi:hypothetical protein